MIFYKNLKGHKKTTEKDLIFSVFDEGISEKDDSVSKSASCKSFYNLSLQDGALKTGLGFSDMQVPASEDNLSDTHTYYLEGNIEELCGIWLNRWFNVDFKEYIYQIIFMDKSFKLYTAPIIDEYDGFLWLKSKSLESEPTFVTSYRIDNEDACLFFSNEGMLYLGQSGYTMYPNVPAFISSVVHYDNFFGITNTNRNTLTYTSNLNLKTWESAESSHIEFLDNRGSFKKLVALNDYVFLFRENGITKVSIYTSQGDFSFTHLFTSSSKIFENSVCVCGEKVFFVTRNALMAFNGNSVAQISDDKIFQMLDNTHCCSACLNGKYYLATRCNFDDESKIGCENQDFVNNVLLEIDIENFGINILRGVDIRQLLAIDIPYMSKLCACFYGEHKQRIGQLDHSGQIFDVSTDKFWTSAKTDLGFYGKRKKVKEIFIETAYLCKVTISSDEETKTFQFDGKSGQQRLAVSVYGTTFQFSFESDSACCDIKKPVIVFDVVS